MNDFFYKKVDAYHLAKEYVVFVYGLLQKYPQYEQYALCSQMRRSAISIPSNIAEAEEMAQRLSKVMSGLKNYLSNKLQ